MKSEGKPGEGKDQSGEHNYTPADLVEWLRIWLTDPNRERSKFVDIGMLALTFIIAVAALVSAWIFQGQLTEARNITKRQFSPYLLYEGGKVAIAKDGSSYTVSIQVKNFGQTPAYSVTHWVTAQAMSHLPDPFAHFDPRQGNVVFAETENQNAVSDIGPGQSICIQKTFPGSHLSGDDVVYVWGDVKYGNQFHRCQFDAFVLQATGPIANGQELKLANIMPWASDAIDPDNCSEQGKAKLPWREEAGQLSAGPTSLSFQGVCPN
jgi:hypothetical protein